jgi:hypothetical protein
MVRLGESRVTIIAVITPAVIAALNFRKSRRETPLFASSFLFIYPSLLFFEYALF